MSQLQLDIRAHLTDIEKELTMDDMRNALIDMESWFNREAKDTPRSFFFEIGREAETRVEREYDLYLFAGYFTAIWMERGGTLPHGLSYDDLKKIIADYMTKFQPPEEEG